MGSADRRKLFEYFIIAGLKNDAHELAPLAHEGGNNECGSVAPITDICVIFPGIGEMVPEGYECIETTPLGHTADLNHGSLRAHSAFLCYRRSYHKPPLVDLGILDDGKGEKLMLDSTIITRTPFGYSANVNNTSHGLYFTTRRSAANAPPHQLVITHIAVILANKGEVPPHTYYKIDKNLNQGMVGSDVYVCYKKSQMSGKRIAYKPEVLDCFPAPSVPAEHDDPTNGDETGGGGAPTADGSLTQNVPMFCLPMGALIESWSDKCWEAEKQFSTCVLTDETGTKYYGASLTFYERYDKPLTAAQLELLELRVANGGCAGGDDDGDEPETATYHCNKAICIVSRYPFFESFRRFLFFLYNVSVAGPYRLPIERYISYLMYEVPFPSPERPRVLVQLAHEMIAFECRDDGQIPLSGAAFVDALKHLGTENFMYAMLLALLEQKILVHSLQPWLLTSVAETICAVMFPFHWQCPYIPQCPLALAGVLHAPLPFIAGVDSRYFDLYEEPQSDVTCFDLDTATVSHTDSPHKALKLSLLPKKPLKRLRTSLDAVLRQMADDLREARNASLAAGGHDHVQLSRKADWEMAIREAFLRFMCSLMAGYQNYLRPILKSPRDKSATDTGALFGLEAFIRSRDKNAIDFYQRFAETQCFNRFIEERCFVSDKNAYNVFFDDCIQRLEQERLTKMETRLLDCDSLLSNHTVVIPSPEESDGNSSGGGGGRREFRYECFPERFEPALFEMERILKSHAAGPRRVLATSCSVDDEKLKFWLIRTKQEVKISLNEAERFVEENAMSWPSSILFYAYSLWFLQLPSMIRVSRNKLKILRLAFKVLCRMERSGVIFHDQVCYRTLIYLCGEYNRPELATEVLLKMARMGVRLNAVTYGIYHWALMQGDWPSEQRLAAVGAWRRVRLRVEVLALFRECGSVWRQREPADRQQFDSTVHNSSSSAPADESSSLAAGDEEATPFGSANSPARSLQALSLSENSSPGRRSTTITVMANNTVDQSDVKFSVDALPLKVDDDGSAVIDMNANEEDPLGASRVNLASADTAAAALKSPSVYLSPSHQRFVREQSATPFGADAPSSADSRASTRKRSLRTPSSWFRGFANSPVVSRFVGTPTVNDSASADGSVKSESASGGISISPSFSSIVHQVRKQALKGYDEVVQQSNVFLKKSGINSFVAEAKNLNKSYSNRDISSLSANLSASFGGGANETFGGAPLSAAALQPSENAFQLDSGHSGDILGAEFWMREILPQNLAEMRRMWLPSSPTSLVDIALCSASKCSKCETIVYDEELVAGWTVERSTNLNANCQHCGFSFLPLLSVSVRRKSDELSASWYVPLMINVTGGQDDGADGETNEEEKRSQALDEGEERRYDIGNKVTDFFSVTFISPLVLRRELETLLAGDPLALAEVSLRATHPVVFWNLLYYCRRLDLPTHMLTWVAPHVHIRCTFDVSALHAGEPPIYFYRHRRAWVGVFLHLAHFMLPPNKLIRLYAGHAQVPTVFRKFLRASMRQASVI